MPLQFPHADINFTPFFLQLHRRLLQSPLQLQLVNWSSSSGAMASNVVAGSWVITMKPYPPFIVAWIQRHALQKHPEYRGENNSWYGMCSQISQISDKIPFTNVLIYIFTQSLWLVRCTYGYFVSFQVGVGEDVEGQTEEVRIVHQYWTRAKIVLCYPFIRNWHW